MNRISVAYLVSLTYSQNEYGVMIAATDKRKVYCDVNSVTQQEWFEGGRNGLNPRYRFRMFKYDYEGERIIEYNNEQYAIYRTYEYNDLIDLYCEMKKGDEKEN